ELEELYRVAPLKGRTLEILKTSFSNSMYVSFAYMPEEGEEGLSNSTRLSNDGDIPKEHTPRGRLIAAGRVLADGAACAYVSDIAVHPDMQGMGIGRSLVSGLLSRCKHHAKIILYASPGKEGFYRKLGFRPMSTAMAIFKV
ncbi:hypothetical protein KIPB_006360, partial [Kipferlia bialata]